MKTEYKIMGVSLFLGMCLWVFDAALDSLTFSHVPFWRILITDVPSHELYTRLAIVVCFIGFGLVMIRVIQKGKMAESTLQNFSVRYQAIMSALPDIIIEVNEKKVYTWTNVAGIQFFGDDVLGKEAAYYFEGEQDTYEQVRPMFNGDESVIYVESWQRRRDGEKRLLS